MSDVRRAVCLALMRQEQEGYSNLVLASALARFDGIPRDRAFFSAVFYGTVERQITLDYLLAKFLQKPLAKLDAPVRAVLRSGLYQARWLGSVPVSAAVNEAVALVKRVGKTSAAGMVNAVLRRAAAVDLDAEKFSDEAQRLGVLYSISPEISALLLEKLPQQAEALCKASFEPPVLCVRVNTLRTRQSELGAYFAARGVAAQPGSVPNSLYLPGYKGDITAEPAFADGLFHVQGEASQFACAALDVRPGQCVLDLCAAPGGKSATLAQYLAGSGKLISRDAVESRLSLISQTVARLGVQQVETAAADASVYDPALPQADRVLCDVPCSGLGVLAKKPDIRLKNLAGLAELCALQHSILCTAARYVKPGGQLVYSTCTVNPDENEAVVRRFLQSHPDWCAVLPAGVPEGGTVQDNCVTLWPFLAKTDGFFVALLQKM